MTSMAINDSSFVMTLFTEVKQNHDSFEMAVIKLFWLNKSQFLVMDHWKGLDPFWVLWDLCHVPIQAIYAYPEWVNIASPHQNTPNISGLPTPSDTSAGGQEDNNSMAISTTDEMYKFHLTDHLISLNVPNVNNEHDMFNFNYENFLRIPKRNYP